MQKIITGVMSTMLIAVLLLSPLKVSLANTQAAASNEAQIQLLLSIIALLQQQLAVLMKNTPTTTPSPVQTPAQKVSLISPNGGETYMSEKGAFTVKWNANGRAVDLYLMTYDGNEYSIASGKKVSGYGVNVYAMNPSFLGKDVNRFKVRVCLSGTQVCDLSDDWFTMSSTNNNSSDNVTPSLTLNASKITPYAGQTTKISWSSKNANRCVLKYGSSEENVSVSGSKEFKPNQTTEYTVWCTNDPGTGKDGLSVTKSTTVSVQYPQQGFSSVEEGLSVYPGSLFTRPDIAFFVTGSRTVTGPITVVLVDVAYSGENDWASVGRLIKDQGQYTAVSKTVTPDSVMGKWSASFGGLSEGYYFVYIYNSEYKMIGSGFLVSTWKG